VLSVLFRTCHLALADPAGEAGVRVGVDMVGVVESVAVLVLAVVALQLSALQEDNTINYFQSTFYQRC